MKKFLFIAASSVILFACNGEKKDDDKKKDDSQPTVSSGTEKKPATELLDLSAGDAVKKSFDAFSKGDVDGMVADFDDNIRYTWSGGDSLIGKQAVKDYYTGRWKLIQSVNYSDRIVLPVQVNESQNPAAAPPGKWVLFWQMADVTYKNNKNVKFWSHSVNHYNDAGKIDFVGMYIDRHPIMEATKDLMK
jgi:hypothetical protein